MSFRAFCVLLVSSMLGCAQEGSNVSTPDRVVAIPVAFNAAGAPTVEFNAPDMMCPEGCGEKVKEILSKQPGAKEVVVDFDSKTATVAVEMDRDFDDAAALAALVDHGFKNSSIKSADAAK